MPRLIKTERTRPEEWSSHRARASSKWMMAFVALEWVWEWVAYWLSGWAFLEVLEYVERLGILVAIIFYFVDSGNRTKQRHYQAWQVINTAQGKGGSGGRVEALQELNADGVPLVGVDVSGAFLQSIHLQGARLVRSNFSGTDLRDSDFPFADFSDANLRSVNFRQSNLHNAHFQHVHLDYADLWGADLSGADLSGAEIDSVDLRFANLANAHWHDLRTVKNANIYGVKNAPDGFISGALQHGAVQSESDSQSQPAP